MKSTLLLVGFVLLLTSTAVFANVSGLQEYQDMVSTTSIETDSKGDYADYGDAPDPPYYSMYENYGARHINSDGIFE